MANRQQSFFDQKPRKPYRPWQARKFNNFTHGPPQPFEPVQPKPPIPASSKSVNKLKAFRYVPTAYAEEGMEGIMAGQKATNKENEPPRMAAQPKSSQDMLEGNKEYPRTPMARVPFQDLIGTVHDEPMDQPPQCTPVDSITWKHSPRSADLERTPRGKKRARSSSPLHSTNAKSRFETLNQYRIDLQPLSNTLTDGQVDLTHDIERRYFGTTVTPSRPIGTTTDLMYSSSPQTPDVNIDSAKLRRTVSCGVAYPHSRAKRQKVEDESSPGVKTPLDRTSIQQGLFKVSKVSVLLEKIEQAEETRADGPSKRTGSLTTRKAGSCRTNPSSENARHQENSDGLIMSAPARVDLVRNENSSSGRVDAKAVRFEDSHDVDMELAGRLDVLQTKQQTDPKVDSDPTDLQQLPKAALPVIDEFDDGDDEMDDIFAADLEDLAAKYDTPSAPQQQLPNNRVCQVGPRSEDTAIHPVPEAPSAPKPTEYVEVSSDDEFGADDFDDIAEELGNMTQAAETEGKGTPKVSVIQRFVVKSVFDSTYQNKSGRNAPEKLLRLEEHRTNAVKLVALRESWWDTAATPGSIVHVIGAFDKKGTCTIDNASGLMILHPDHLLSATVVADAFKCIRRAVLQDRVKATNEAGEAQVYGHVLHEIFQEALKANLWDDVFLEKIIRGIAQRYNESLFELNIPLDLAVQHLVSKIPTLQSWAKTFISLKHHSGSFIKGPKEEMTPTIVTKLLDVEEHVWSPKYGLKGNIDATIQVAITEEGQRKNLLVPFEVKTGRKQEQQANISHNSQTALYTLLLSDRYDVQIAFGILYYLETSEMSRITAQRQEIVGMLQRRNELACYVKDRTSLPPMLKNKHTCGHCYAKTSCFVYHKLSEDGDEKTSGLGSLFTDAMHHLQPVHAEFFKRWDDLLTKEERDALRFRKELWTMKSAEREKIGRCFGELIIKPGSSTENANASKINRFEYILVKPGAKIGFSFAESQINLGEPIVISDESGHYALANGYVTKIRTREIHVAVDRRLHNARVRRMGFDENTNQSFAGVMEVAPASVQTPPEPEEPLKYRLDKDEFSNGMATVRNNLIRAMEKDLFGAQFIRRLVIEDVAPSFNLASSHVKKHFANRNEELNIDQRNAINKVMEAQEYALVLGMPGTGKTTTISHIIRALTASGKSVLLTSYTHTAVDNILLKIRSDNLSILRIGAEAKIHPEIKEFANLASTPKQTFEEVEESYKSQVVATTCLGINHPIFNQRTFDYCIVDEASQVTLPVCLGPIRMAHRFVLVGDHYQLPPLVQNKEAREGGLDISLFKLLSDRHPESVVNLEHQYRMCEDIMSLSNTLIYSGQLKCGTPAVASRSLHIPFMEGLSQHHHTETPPGLSQSVLCPGPVPGACWLRDVLDPQRRVVFINTDPLESAAREIASDSRVTNPLEVALATQLVTSLITIGISPSEIGIVTLYRSQLSLLRQSLRSHTGTAPTGGAQVEMHTADKFQGRDKEVVVLSLVRSNEANNVGDLLQDWRRVNVALTRARTKMVILGSWSTISKGNELLGKFCDLVDANNWRFDLPRGSLDAHWFEDLGTQLTLTGAAGKVTPQGKGQGKGKAALSASLSEEWEKEKVSPLKGRVRVPEKKGKVDIERILGSRPVLRDIANEINA